MEHPNVWSLQMMHGENAVSKDDSALKKMKVLRRPCFRLFLKGSNFSSYKNV